MEKEDLVRRLAAFVLTMMSLVGLGTLAMPAYAAPASGGVPSGASIEKRPARVALEPSMNEERTKLLVKVSYASEQLVWKAGGHGGSVWGVPVRAVELLINGASREVQMIAPSVQGEVVVAVPVERLSEAERTQELKLQAKIYSHFVQAPVPLPLWVNKPLATSGVVSFWVDPVTWTGSPLAVGGLNGTMVSATAEFTSKAKIPQAQLKILPQWAALPAGTAAAFDIEPGVAYMLPVTLVLPTVQAAGVYEGFLELRSGDTLVSRLPLKITVTAAASNVVPQTMTAASDDHLTTDALGQLVKDEIIVGLDEALAGGDERIMAIAAETGAGIMGAVPGANLYVLRYANVNLTELEVMRQRVVGLAGVAFASLNYVASRQALPNDTGYPEGSWKDEVQDDKTWALKYIHAPEAWDQTTGSREVRLGIIDSGFALAHEDLLENIGPRLGSSSSIHKDFHGNNVAGAMCAVGNNGRGVTGVSWRCNLTTYQVIRQDTSLNAAAMIQAARNGMQIVNMSLAWEPARPSCDADYQPPKEFDSRFAQMKATYRRAFSYAKTNNKDVLWVFAAGNKCNDVKLTAPNSLITEFPENIIVTGAVSPDQERTPGTNYGDLVTISAPGEKVYTTHCGPTWGGCGSQPRYSLENGTSLAAGMVSGVAALVSAKHRSFTASQLKQCIVNGAVMPVRGEKHKVVDASEALYCQPAPATPCEFKSTNPSDCQSTNPTVTMFSTNSGNTSGCVFKVHVDWGDGQAQDYILNGSSTPGITAYAQHAYAKRGTYQIKATGTVQQGFCSISSVQRTFRLRP